MSYRSVALMAADNGIKQRLIACAAIEGIETPWVWVDQNIWTFAAQPGWGEAYAYALNIHKDEPGYEPGWDEAVIADPMILASTQAIKNSAPTE